MCSGHVDSPRRPHPGALLVALGLAFGLSPVLADEPRTSAPAKKDPGLEEPAVKAPTERIEVSATQGGDVDAPTGMASTVVDLECQPGNPGAAAALAGRVAGVSENGQGGLFQSVSIRGTARQRILQMVDGMRIKDDRRSGPATSFLDPYLIRSIDVLRGPASSYYGSGALGGVLQVFPRWFDGARATAGYLGEGEGSLLQAAWGNDNLSFGAVRRAVGDAETPDGELRLSRFRQVSATLAGQWRDLRRTYRLLWAPSVARNIGKPNTDAPGRTTIYPEEQHHLVHFAVQAEETWQASVWLHPHSLDTEVTESDGSRSFVANESFDLSARWSREQRPRSLTVRWGFDSLHRRGVDAVETRTDAAGTTMTTRSLDDAGADELGAFATVSGDWGPAGWEAGGRLTWLAQRNEGFEDSDDAAPSGFFGATVPLAGRLRFRGHLGTGLRFPTLTERFFTGTTGRGQVIGNPGLDPERSYNIEAGLQWLGQRLAVTGALFHNEIDDFIERLETSPGLLTFINLTSGTIRGIETEATWQAGAGWRLSGGGHLMEGRSDDGRPLSDVPPSSVFAGADLSRDRWSAGARLEWRARKDDPGSGEKEIGSAVLLSADVLWRVAPTWTLQLRGDNLLNDTYFPSADDKSQTAAKRSFGAFVTWAAAARR